MQHHHQLLFRQVLLSACAFVLARNLTSGAPIFYVAGLLALLGSLMLRNPRWWHLIHLLFFPAVYSASTLGISSGTYLALFALSALVFLGTLVSRVPLYLSGAQQCERLVDHCSRTQPKHFADLGAGIGSAVIPLARAFPNMRCVAYEIAPLSYLVGRFRSRGIANLCWRWGRFESVSLGEFDLVYTFLSPEPMPALWLKAQREMPDGSTLISNTFPISEAAPETVYAENTLHPLFVYRIVSPF